MKLITLIAFTLVAGCSTTPNTEAQMMAADMRQEHREWKAWCIANNGVAVEDNVYGRKCFRADDFRYLIGRQSFA